MSDTILERAQQFLANRVTIGEARYGRTLDDNPAPVLERLQHLKEELADGLQYVLWAEDEIARLQRDSEAVAVAKAEMQIATNILAPDGGWATDERVNVTYSLLTDALSRISEIQGTSLQEKEG